MDAVCGLLWPGHSLGGAVAQLCALDLLRSLTDLQTATSNITCITFAAPAVGNATLAELLDKRGWHGRLLNYLLPGDGTKDLSTHDLGCHAILNALKHSASSCALMGLACHTAADVIGNFFGRHGAVRQYPIESISTRDSHAGQHLEYDTAANNALPYHRSPGAAAVPPHALGTTAAYATGQEGCRKLVTLASAALSGCSIAPASPLLASFGQDSVANDSRSACSCFSSAASLSMSASSRSSSLSEGMQLEVQRLAAGAWRREFLQQIFRKAAVLLTIRGFLQAYLPVGQQKMLPHSPVHPAGNSFESSGASASLAGDSGDRLQKGSTGSILWMHRCVRPCIWVASNATSNGAIKQCLSAQAANVPGKNAGHVPRLEEG